VSKFLVIHPVGGDMTLESGTPIAKSIKSHQTSDAYWRRSYYAPDLPTEGPFKIELDIHSEDFR